MALTMDVTTACAGESLCVSVIESMGIIRATPTTPLN